MLNLVATICVAALSEVNGGIVTSGAVPAVTFHRDNHAKRAAMGYAAASARLRRAVLEAKSAAWDEEEAGWDKDDEEWAHKAQTASRELLAYAEKVALPAEDQKKSEPQSGTLRGTASMQNQTAVNHTKIEHPVYQVGGFGLKSKLLEVATPDSDDDDDEAAKMPHPYVHYKKIVNMVKDARNEIKAAKWDADHETQVDSTAQDEGKKVVFAAGKLVSVLAQVISWAKAHQSAENSTAENSNSAPAVSKRVAPPRALAAHSNSSTKVVTVNATVNTTKNSTIVPKVTAAANTSAAVAPVSNKTSAAVSNKTLAATTSTTAAPKAASSNADIENEATKQAEVVESSSKKIAAAVKELDEATNEVRKDDPSVEDVMSELDKATGKLENATTRISLKIIAHRLVEDSRKKAKEEVVSVEKPAVNATKNTTSDAQEAPATVQKANATAPAPQVNVTESAQVAAKHEVKVTANVSVPKSFVKQAAPVKEKSPEEQMDELLNAEASKKEAEDEVQETEQAKAQATREKQEADELKKQEAEIEKEQEIEADKEAAEKKEESEQLEEEEKDADEEMKAEAEERKAKALMRIAKKRRAKLSKAKSNNAGDSAELGF